MRIAQGDSAHGTVLSEQINDLDSLPFPRWDLVTEVAAQLGFKFVHRARSAADIPLLASRGCPEFCTYCPHRILAGYRARSIANIVDEIERLCDQHAAAVRDLPRSVVQRAARPVSGVVRRDPRARPDADVRGRNAARSARRPICSTSLYDRGFPGDELRRRIARPGDAEEVGPPADSADAPATDHRTLPEAGDRHGGVLCARVPAGRLELDRRDDRLLHRSRVDVRAVQDPDAVSRHADVQAVRAAAHGDGLGEVRRLHADVRAPEPVGA